jgi:hypothetical protein
MSFDTPELLNDFRRMEGGGGIGRIEASACVVQRTFSSRERIEECSAHDALITFVMAILPLIAKPSNLRIAAV